MKSWITLKREKHTMLTLVRMLIYRKKGQTFRYNLAYLKLKALSLNDMNYVRGVTSRYMIRQLELKKEELLTQGLYLRWTFFSYSGNYWHITMRNPVNHKGTYWDLRPSDIKNEELDGIRCNDYIEWGINLMKSQVV